jgi:glycosyltransferase involved in cell wall biosynthesis
LDKNRISAVIITFNEASSIGRCLTSLDGIADEIIVVDSYSTDSTEEICRAFNAKFIKHEFKGYMDQKNFSLSLASNNFVISLDADEALSDTLRKSIAEIKSRMNADGYLFNRLGFFNGKWIKHSSWYPDRQLRLFKKNLGKWGTSNVHEHFIMDRGTKIARLNGDLLHWPYKSVDDFSATISIYSGIAARELFEKGEKASFFAPFIHCLWRFLKSYIINLGILDGRNGWILCSLGARSSFLKYSILRDLNKNAKKKF